MLMIDDNYDEINLVKFKLVDFCYFVYNLNLMESKSKAQSLAQIQTCLDNILASNEDSKVVDGLGILQKLVQK